MRDIKFRAWDGETMYDSDSVVAYLGAGFIERFSFDEDAIRLEKTVVTHLMQYTGLKDKNGVEIYEGDILEICALHPVKPTFVTEVKWNKGSFTASKGRLYRTLAHWAAGGVEIIGNIYESPELLEQM
jgi:uncharacterized phage protein (TIGR01671 family)